MFFCLFWCSSALWIILFMFHTENTDSLLLKKKSLHIQHRIQCFQWRLSHKPPSQHHSSCVSVIIIFESLASDRLLVWLCSLCGCNCAAVWIYNLWFIRLNVVLNTEGRDEWIVYISVIIGNKLNCCKCISLNVFCLETTKN